MLMRDSFNLDALDDSSDDDMTSGISCYAFLPQIMNRNDDPISTWTNQWNNTSNGLSADNQHSN